LPFTASIIAASRSFSDGDLAPLPKLSQFSFLHEGYGRWDACGVVLRASSAIPWFDFNGKVSPQYLHRKLATP
jgi:hypothetical protein